VREPRRTPDTRRRYRRTGCATILQIACSTQIRKGATITMTRYVPTVEVCYVHIRGMRRNISTNPPNTRCRANLIAGAVHPEPFPILFAYRLYPRRGFDSQNPTEAAQKGQRAHLMKLALGIPTKRYPLAYFPISERSPTLGCEYNDQHELASARPQKKMRRRSFRASEKMETLSSPARPIPCGIIRGAAR